MKLYVKTQGKTVGPLDWDRILALHGNGRLAVDATVSEDKITWLTIEQVKQLVNKNSNESSKSNSLSVVEKPSLPQTGLQQPEGLQAGYMPPSQLLNNGGYAVPQPPDGGGYGIQSPNNGGYAAPQPPNGGSIGIQPPNNGGYNIPQPPNNGGFNVQNQVGVYPQNAGYNAIQNPNISYSGGINQNNPTYGMPMNTSNMRIAGVWERFGALLIDGIVMNICAYVLSFIVGFGIGIIAGANSVDNETTILISTIAGYIIRIIFCLGYEAFFLSNYGATPGKMLFHIKVLYNGRYLTKSRAIGRYFAKCLSGLILCIGYFVAFFNQEHKALHDNICDTIVVKMP